MAVESNMPSAIPHPSCPPCAWEPQARIFSYILNPGKYFDFVSLETPSTLFYNKKCDIWSGLLGRSVRLSYDKLQQDDGEIEGRASFSVSFEFSVSLPEVQRRTLDVAVKNSGGFLSKDKGLLGKVSLSRPL